MRPTKYDLERLYCQERSSVIDIGRIYNVTPRTVSNWCKTYGIKLLGPAFTRKGKPAPWNIGRPQSPEQREKNRLAHIGHKAYNRGRRTGDVQFKCEICGREVFDKPYRKKYTCSNTCRALLGKRLRGEKHWCYKPQANHNKTVRCWSAYREWRATVMNRDRHACRKCGAKKKLLAHHIRSIRLYPELRFSVENGLTLCRSCHWDLHRKAGRGVSTHTIFDAWITAS